MAVSGVAILRELEAAAVGPELALKHDDLIYDLGLLAAMDPHALDPAALAADREELLKRTASENTQLLLKHLFELPSEIAPDVGPVVVLPARTTRLPREQPPPQKAEPTRWEAFAASKGIVKKKRSRMVLDEAADEWKPRHGYKRARDATGEWVYELKAGDDPKVDHIERRELLKKQRVVQNKLNQVGNAERATQAAERKSGATSSAAIFANKEGEEEGGKPRKALKQRKGGARGGREEGDGGEGDGGGKRLPAGIPSIPIAEGRADAVSGPGKQRRFAPSDAKGVKQAQLRMAQVSTGSLGKFDRAMEGEPVRPKVAHKVKRLPNEVSHASEQSRDSNVLRGIIDAAERRGGAAPSAPSSGGALGASGYKAKKQRKREAAAPARGPKGAFTSSGFKSGGSNSAGKKGKGAYKKGGGHAGKGAKARK